MAARIASMTVLIAWPLFGLFPAAAPLAGSAVPPAPEPGVHADSRSSEWKMPDWLQLAGYFQSTCRQSVHKEEPIAATQRLWLETHINEGETVSAFASGYVDADFSVYGRKNSKEPVVIADVGEAYVTLDTRHVDVIAGMQQIRWGEADSLSTFDVFNPVDYRSPISTARSTARLSVGAIDVRANVFGQGVFDFIFVPVPRFTPLPEGKGPWEEKGLKYMRAYGDMGLVERDDADGAHSPEFGARLKFYQQGFDFAFLFFRGYEHVPRYDTDISTVYTIGKPTLRSEYEMFTAYGISMAVSAWESTFRGEFTLKQNYPFQGTSTVLYGGIPFAAPKVERRNEYEALVGWDKTFLTNLNVNLQAFYFSHSGAEVEGKQRNRYGYTWSVSDKFLEDALTAGFRGEFFANNGDYCMELFAEYEYDDNLKFTAGYMFFGGKPTSDLGQFDQNDHFYVGVKYSF